MTKATFLFFDSKDTVTLKKSEIREGKAIIDNKVYLIDEDIRSKILKTGFLIFKSYKPFYIIRHDKVVPLEFSEERKGLINPITPESLKKIIKNETLMKMLTPR